MTTPKHTPEPTSDFTPRPWDHYTHARLRIETGGTTFLCRQMSDDDYRLAKACVNALADYDPSAVRDVVEAAKWALDEMNGHPRGPGCATSLAAALAKLEGGKS